MNKALLLDMLLKRKSLHLEDPTVYLYWDEMTGLLSEDAEETVMFFNECTEDQIAWFSEIFEDVSYNLQSQKYIVCLEQLLSKFPEIPIKESVKAAKENLLRQK